MRREFLKYSSLVCLSLISATCFAEQIEESLLKEGASPSPNLVPAVREKSISIVRNLASRVQDLVSQVEHLQNQIQDIQEKNVGEQIASLRSQMRDFQVKTEEKNFDAVSDLTTQILAMSKDLNTRIGDIQQKITDVDEKHNQTPLQESLKKLFSEVDFLKAQLVAIEEKQNQNAVEQVLSNVVLHLKTAEEQIINIEAKLQDVTSIDALNNLTTQISNMQSEMNLLTAQVQETPTINSMKQLTVQVNNVQNELQDVKTDMQVPKDEKIVLDNATTRGRYGGFITAEWLFWQFYEGGTDFAATYDTIFTDATNKSIDFDWSSGFRVGLGYIFERDDWDLYASYTQIFNSGTKSVHGNLFPLLLFQPTLAKISSMDNAKSHWKVEFRNADLDLGREFFVGKWLSIHPSFGLKGAWIDQHASIDYCRTTFSSAIEESSVRIKNDFSGVGPKLGASGNWFLCRTFSIYAGITGALLWGEFTLKQTQEVANNETVELKSKLMRLAPTAQIRAGFLWDAFFNRNRNHFGINLGWEMQYWWRQNQLERFTDSTLPIYLRESDDLGMQGLTLGVRFDY